MTEPRSSYTHYLPPILGDSETVDGFLLAFEQLLSAEPAGSEQPALETLIDRTDKYLRPTGQTFDPDHRAPEEFLPWLARWVAVSLRDDWTSDTKRVFIHRAVELYRERGTKAGLEKMLGIYLGAAEGDRSSVTIYDTAEDFGYEPPPHYFQVAITVPGENVTQLRRVQQIAQAIIEQEKPAHTYYGLQFLTPTMQLNSEGSGRAPMILGQNTLLGTQEAGS